MDAAPDLATETTAMGSKTREAEMTVNSGAAPLHVHNNEDEFFLVLSGEIRVQHGDGVLP